ncbi:hypothetical protein C789_4300 [Microcystis aeruginosa FACHB-905 = DIANCHI905]|nr:hypothetical protein C789_4300 [Microcystis aeruginosa FACHB-905 = DIANCHI905]
MKREWGKQNSPLPPAYSQTCPDRIQLNGRFGIINSDRALYSPCNGEFVDG